MRPDPTTVVTAMAKREADAALLPPPPEEAGADGGSCLVRVRMLDCPTCGARRHDRQWTPPFSTTVNTGPVLTLLACEWLTARAVLPAVWATKNVTELHDAAFETRGVTWLEVAHLELDKALEAVDAAERWIDDPLATRRRTLPASVRAYRPDPASWSQHREGLVPSFLAAHPTVPASLERHYALQRGAAVLANYDGVRGNR